MAGGLGAAPWPANRANIAVIQILPSGPSAQPSPRRLTSRSTELRWASSFPLSAACALAPATLSAKPAFTTATFSVSLSADVPKAH